MSGNIGKTAVITGASSGVGRSAAIELARQGWGVIGLGRDPVRSAEAVTAISAVAAAGSRAHMITGDPIASPIPRGWPMRSSPLPTGSTRCATTPAASGHKWP